MLLLNNHLYQNQALDISRPVAYGSICVTATEGVHQ
jgi:hypothetical protein